MHALADALAVIPDQTSLSLTTMDFCLHERVLFISISLHAGGEEESLRRGYLSRAPGVLSDILSYHLWLRMWCLDFFCARSSVHKIQVTCMWIFFRMQKGFLDILID